MLMEAQKPSSRNVTMKVRRTDEASKKTGRGTVAALTLPDSATYQEIHYKDEKEDPDADEDSRVIHQFH